MGASVWVVGRTAEDREMYRIMLQQSSNANKLISENEGRKPASYYTVQFANGSFLNYDIDIPEVNENNLKDRI